MKKLLTARLALAGSSALYAVPEITSLKVEQNSGRLVSIAYVLSEDAIVTLDMCTNGVSIGSVNFQRIFDPYAAKAGTPVNKVVKKGAHTIMWQPNREWPGYVFRNGEFRVELKAWSLANPPDYMVVDLMTPSNRWFYAKAEDLPGGIKMISP